MMKKMMYLAAAALLLVACNSGKTTKVAARWEDEAPQKVKFSVAGNDTSVGVKDGKLEAKLPVDVTSVSTARAGSNKYTFIADGSKLTLDVKEGKFVSSKKNGVHARYEAYNEWKKAFMDDYFVQMGKLEEGSGEAEAYFKQSRDKYNKYLVKTLKANRNNYVGALAASDLALEDPDEILSLIGKLSSRIQALPMVVETKQACETVKANNQ